MPQKRQQTAYLAATHSVHCRNGLWSSGGAGVPQPQHGCSRSFRESESEAKASVAAAAGAASLEEGVAIVSQRREAEQSSV